MSTSTPEDGQDDAARDAVEQAEQHDPDGDAGQLHPRHGTTPSHDGVLDDTEPGHDPDGDPGEMPDR